MSTVTLTTVFDIEFQNENPFKCFEWALRR